MMVMMDSNDYLPSVRDLTLVTSDFTSDSETDVSSSSDDETDSTSICSTIYSDATSYSEAIRHKRSDNRMWLSFASASSREPFAPVLDAVRLPASTFSSCDAIADLLRSRKGQVRTRESGDTTSSVDIPSVAVLAFLPEALARGDRTFIRRPPWRFHHTETVSGQKMTAYTNQDYFFTDCSSPLCALRVIHTGRPALRLVRFVSRKCWSDSVQLYSLLLGVSPALRKRDFVLYCVSECGRSDVQLALKRLPAGARPRVGTAVALEFKVHSPGQVVALLPNACVQLTDTLWRSHDLDGCLILLRMPRRRRPPREKRDDDGDMQTCLSRTLRSLLFNDGVLLEACGEERCRVLSDSSIDTGFSSVSSNSPPERNQSRSAKPTSSPDSYRSFSSSLGSPSDQSADFSDSKPLTDTQHVIDSKHTTDAKNVTEKRDLRGSCVNSKCLPRPAYEKARREKESDRVGDASESYTSCDSSYSCTCSESLCDQSSCQQSLSYSSSYGTRSCRCRFDSNASSNHFLRLSALPNFLSPHVNELRRIHRSTNSKERNKNCSNDGIGETQLQYSSRASLDSATAEKLSARAYPTIKSLPNSHQHVQSPARTKEITRRVLNKNHEQNSLSCQVNWSGNTLTIGTRKSSPKLHLSNDTCDEDERISALSSQGAATSPTLSTSDTSSPTSQLSAPFELRESLEKSTLADLAGNSTTQSQAFFV